MVGLATRQRRAEQERQIKELESGILRVERALRKWRST
jgi:exonuclease VII small subunit